VDYRTSKNCGVALSKLARLKRGDESDKLFSMAQEKFRSCVQMKSTDNEIFFNWGNALYRQAKVKQQEHKVLEYEQLLIGSGEKYFSSLNIKTDYVDALYNWCKVLESQQKIMTEDKEKLAHILYQVDKFLEFFENTATKEFSPVRLRCLISLSKSNNPEVKLKVTSTIKRLTNIGPDHIKLEAQQALIVIQNRKTKELRQIRDEGILTNSNVYASKQIESVVVSPTLNTVVENQMKGKFHGFTMVELEMKSTLYQATNQQEENKPINCVGKQSPTTGYLDN